MIKKVIALVFVSFFVMSGLTVLTENNLNYNISENNINSFTLISNNTFNFSINKTIVYSKGISSGGQTFGCYNNSLYYINGSAIYQFNVSNQKTTNFRDLSTQAYQLEIYNNYMIIGYGSGNTIDSSTLVNVYNFYNSMLYTLTLTNSYYYLQFAIVNNIMYVAGISSSIYIYSISLIDSSISLVDTLSMGSFGNQLSVASDNNNIIFATTDSADQLIQYAFVNILLKTFNTSVGNGNSDFANINSIIDLGDSGILGSQSYYITDSAKAGITQYSYNAYDSGLYFADSNYLNYFVPFSLSGLTFTKLPTYNTNYQEFYYKNNISYVYLPIGNGNNIFNSQSYIINGNHNLYIVNNNNLYVYSYNLKFYNLNVKSYNLENNQIENYFSLNGIIYRGFSNNFNIANLPITITPLNTSTYFYNGSAIIITQSDFSGSGSNLYYNLSIYYGFGNVQSTITSNSLYLIILYVVIGLGLAIFVIASVRYRI